MTFDKDFKNAISYLPSKEKDKLILRLLKRDIPLANRLYFELVSDLTVDEHRREMERRVVNEVERMTRNFYSPGYLLVDMRYLSGEITSHVKTTKDKFGEASLNLLMLNEVLAKNSDNVILLTPSKARTFCAYVIARAFKILLLIDKLDDDYALEFEANLIKLGNLIGKNKYLMQRAIHNGLDVNWLITFSIPSDIVAIHKNLRARGYL